MPRRYTPEQRVRFVTRYRKSGLSQRDFAEREGISVSALQGWLYRRGKKVEPAAHFVEVVPAPVAEAEAIEIRLGKVELRLPASTTTQRVAAIVIALEGAGSAE